MCVQDWPVEAACALGFCGWQGEELETVGQVEEFFARLCFEADQRLGEPAACRWFLNWFDDTPRADMRRELLGEVERALAERLPLEQAEKIEKRINLAVLSDTELGNDTGNENGTETDNESEIAAA
jgi:hypothetical protein